MVVTLNGQVLGDVRWNGRFAHRAVFEFPSALLHAGDNTVELYLPADLPGVANDYVLLNYLRLSYRKRFVAEQGRAFFAGGSGSEFEVAGFAPGDVLGADVSDRAAPRWVRGISVPGGVARFNDSVTRTGGRYVLAGSGALAAPDRIDRNAPSSWHDAGNRADCIAITHLSLLAGVDPLADHRSSLGLSTAAADEDVLRAWVLLGDPATRLR
ncbi:MAG: hypothetical protein HY720_19675 [Planctomycetes bacterium]|nr:hypothetical protein [Planctomycetota bacterium]